MTLLTHIAAGLFPQVNRLMLASRDPMPSANDRLPVFKADSALAHSILTAEQIFKKLSGNFRFSFSFLRPMCDCQVEFTSGSA